MEQEYEVQYEVTFRCKVKCKREDLSDRISDIDIPESEGSEYMFNTFEVLSVKDKDGKDVTVDGEEIEWNKG